MQAPGQARANVQAGQGQGTEHRRQGIQGLHQRAGAVPRQQGSRGWRWRTGHLHRLAERRQLRAQLIEQRLKATEQAPTGTDFKHQTIACQGTAMGRELPGPDQ